MISVFDIPHRGHYGLIREDLLGICDGSIPTAVLLNNFETWTKTREGEMIADPNKSPWLYEPAKVIQSWSPWIAIPTIRKSLKFLIKKGFLKSRKTKNYNDNSCEYLLNVEAVINALKSFWEDKQSLVSDQNDHKVKGSDQNDHKCSDHKDHFSLYKDQRSNDLSPPTPSKSQEGKKERGRKVEAENQEPEVQAIAYGENQDKNSSLAKIPDLGEDQSSASALMKKSFLGFQIPEERHQDLIYAGEETPWLEPPKSKRNSTIWNKEFLKWHGDRWMKKFNKADIYEAMADFRRSLENNPEKIRIAWDEYEMYQLHRVGNVATRSENGVSIPDEEKHQIEKHLPVLTRSESARETLSQMAEVAKTPIAISGNEEVIALPSDETGLTDNVEAYREADLEQVAPPPKGKFDPEVSKEARQAARERLKAMGLCGGKSQSFTSKLTQAVASLEQTPQSQIEKELPFMVQKANSPYLEHNQEAEKWCQKNGFVIIDNGQIKEIIQF